MPVLKTSRVSEKKIPSRKLRLTTLFANPTGSKTRSTKNNRLSHSFRSSGRKAHQVTQQARMNRS